MGWSIKIGSVKGTAIRLHFTFFLFLVWIGTVFYLQRGMEAAVSGVTFLLLLFVCVVLHEFGHIAAARRFGVRTPEVVLLPIGGMSRLERIPERPREELLIALAGPAVTLTIAALLVLILGGLPDPMQVLSEPTGRNLLGQLAYANLVLLVFNLIPAFPLDGGRVLRALLSARMGHLRGTRIAATTGKAAAIVFGLIGLMSGNVILVLIALFIYIAAGAEAGLAQLRGITFGVPAGEVMITAFESLTRTAPVSDAAEALIRTSQREFPIIDEGGRLLGVLTREGIIKALSEGAGSTPVGEVMQADVPSISRWHRLDDTFRLLERGKPVIAVTGSDSRLVGLITWENLMERLMIEQARGRRSGMTQAPPPPARPRPS